MDLLLSSWPELVSAGRNALQTGDTTALAHIDGALHHRFFGQLDGGDLDSRHQFALDLGDLTESPEARAIPAAEPARRYLIKWAHLAELSSALGDDVTAEEEARDLIRARQHGQPLLEIVAAAGADGIRQGDLAHRLDLSPSHLSNLLTEFEAHDLIERRKFGKYVHVMLGLLGQLVSDRGPRAVPPKRPQLPDTPDLWRDTPANGPCLARLA